MRPTTKLVGLLLADHQSYLAQQPSWQPDQSLMRNKEFKMADLIRAAIQETP